MTHDLPWTLENVHELRVLFYGPDLRITNSMAIMQMYKGWEDYNNRVALTEAKLKITNKFFFDKKLEQLLK